MIVPDSATSAMILRRSLMVSRSEPVLDAALVHADNETWLAILTGDAVIVYRQQAGQWVQELSAAIQRGTVYPLDLRGRLVSTGEQSLDPYLPGTVCSINIAPTQLHADCHDADDAWPLGSQAAFLNARRNYFNGLMRPGFDKQLPPFFSAAALPFPGYTLWIFDGVDGQIRTHDGTHESTLNVRDWGSDLVAIHSGCGRGTQLLVTSISEAGANDSLRGFEMVERQPVLVVPAVGFAGEITAMWPTADGSEAIVIQHNARTETFEVFNVSIGCN